jgi:hypothetical protein
LILTFSAGALEDDVDVIDFFVIPFFNFVFDVDQIHHQIGVEILYDSAAVLAFEVEMNPLSAKGFQFKESIPVDTDLRNDIVFFEDFNIPVDRRQTYAFFLDRIINILCLQMLLFLKKTL